MKPEQADVSGRSERAVRLEAEYPHPPERLWHALTDAGALKQWLLPTTFRPHVGHRFQFTHAPDGGRRRKVQCQVVEADAPRRLAYTWQEDGEAVPTLVTWTLEPTEGGTRLRLEHLGPQASVVSAPSGAALADVCSDALRVSRQEAEHFAQPAALPQSRAEKLPSVGRVALLSQA